MRSSPTRIDTRARRLVDDPDGVLVARARDRDRAAFEELARRHGDRLYAVVRGLGLGQEAAREVTQEAFLRAWRGIGAFSGDARFFTWLYRIGVNEAKRLLAREPASAIPVSLDAENAPDPPDMHAEPQAQLVAKELREALVRAVRTLPLKYRAPLILRDIEGLSTADAAAILGLGEAAFKSRLHRARLAVRDTVSDYIEPSG
jgi:RNA polymerase sigma-70 factor (ECF subfamily)